MVPPEVSARNRVPRRACRRSFTRSHSTRGATPFTSWGSGSASERTTSRNVSRVSARYGAAWMKRFHSASVSIDSAATAATICCASTSSGAFGIAMRSSVRSWIERTTAAASTSSSPLVTTMRPLDTRESAWPARPTRCSAAATLRGDCSWTTRSMAPTSMPSSSDDVATSALSWPSLSRFSASSRARRESEPWWAATRPSTMRSFRSRANRAAEQRVDLVHDDEARARQRRAETGRGQQDVERLRRRDEDVRRPPRHGLPLRRQRVARADGHADLGQVEPLRLGGGADSGQRRTQVLLDVVVQRAQGRDVDDVDAVLEPALQPEAVQVVERPQERCQRLAGARRRDDERVASGGDRVPAVALRGRRLGEGRVEPATDERQELGHVRSLYPARPGRSGGGDAQGNRA